MTCSPTGGSWWSRRRTRPTYRPCRSSSRSPASGSGTAWCARRTTGTGGSPARRGRCSTCSTSPLWVGPSAATSSSPATGSPTGAGCTTSPAVGMPISRGRTASTWRNRIDTLLADPLRFLPASVFGEREQDVDFDDPARNLAFRNLVRGSMLKLASGQQMVERLNSLGVNVRAADQEPDPRAASGGAKLPASPTPRRTPSPSRTPLWFYILREAETGNGRMRGVGGRIVAETFHRAMEGSRFSILREPDFGRGTAAGTPSR